MADNNGIPKPFQYPLDPMMYIGRVKRDDNGRVENIEVFYDDSIIHLEENDEFITFTTVVLLENAPNIN